ncbi:coronin [Elysia marginata]|uniref:Coronin n=1 Tax=Elysia marginata TaxID=1093978 RepID=A0AAV4IBR4_9GAST|nr:coronin [Elysia marginata]
MLVKKNINYPSQGDRIINTYEVSEEEPHLFACAPFKMETALQGVSFLPKRVCDVRAVEVARAWRLTDHSVEGLTFTVPRVKMEFFQDDLYPPTQVTWKPTMTAAEWLSGSNRQAETISLRPPDMTPCKTQGRELFINFSCCFIVVVKVTIVIEY